MKKEENSSVKKKNHLAEDGIREFRSLLKMKVNR